MATSKKFLGVRVSPDLLANLKYIHSVEGREREKTGNKISFSSWVEEILGTYSYERIVEIKAIAKMKAKPEEVDWSDFDE